MPFLSEKFVEDLKKGIAFRRDYNHDDLKVSVRRAPKKSDGWEVIVQVWNSTIAYQGGILHLDAAFKIAERAAYKTVD